MKKLIVTLVLAVTIVGAVLAMNHVAAGRPVSEALASDPRNEAFEMSGRLGSYFSRSTLVLNLHEADSASPADLWRGLFQVAEAFHERNRRFNMVVLSAAGTPVFTMSGVDFADLGAEFSTGQNPIYLIRKLPEKLRTPDGTQAYDPSYSGWIVAVSEEINNASDAASKWASAGL